MYSLTPRVQTPAARGVAASLLLMLMTATAAAEPQEFVIDPEHFSIGFLTEHVGYNDVLGMFLEGSGRFVYDEENRDLTSGKIVIESASVFTNHEERDEHLRKDDFLDAAEHSEIVFEVTGFETTSENTGKVTGDLTMLGETHPVTLDVTLNKTGVYPFGHEEYVLGASARTTLERSKWGMTYGVEEDLVGDEVDLILEFEAIRQ